MEFEEDATYNMAERGAEGLASWIKEQYAQLDQRAREQHQQLTIKKRARKNAYIEGSTPTTWAGVEMEILISSRGPARKETIWFKAWRQEFDDRWYFRTTNLETACEKLISFARTELEAKGGLP